LSVSSYNLNSPAPVAPFAIPTQPPSLISKSVLPSYWLNFISFASTCAWKTTSEELFEIFNKFVPSSAKTKSAPPASKVISAAASTVKLFADIVLDAAGNNVTFKSGGTSILDISNSSSDAVITSSVQDKDIIFKGDDGGSAITALTLDMSAKGAATFNDKVIAEGGQLTTTGKSLVFGF